MVGKAVECELRQFWYWKWYEKRKLPVSVTQFIVPMQTGVGKVWQGKAVRLLGNRPQGEDLYIHSRCIMGQRRIFGDAGQPGCGYQAILEIEKFHAMRWVRSMMHLGVAEAITMFDKQEIAFQ